MATNHRARNEYTVGWICALPKEQTAATAMLDELHPELSDQPASDKNTYTLGSIGKHNIVIACLPKGIYGTNSAAAAATQMVTTFPSIKVGLLVGIGGGIPPTVRLGDVVVSVPKDEYPGVVQWDFGKAEQGGKFKRTGALNTPPRALLTAVTKLESQHEMKGSQIPKYLQDVEVRWPRLASKYTQRGSLWDPISTAVDEDERREEDVTVHYGLVASGNMVIKDSKRRDIINRSLGGNVLCVEMEAAGLMNDFPCIVIRGICDYADSQKNDKWQNYAAAVAAGCAKEFLKYVQPSDIDGERPAKEILGNVLDTVSETRADVIDIRAKLDRKEDIDVLNWLTPINYNSQQTDFINRRQRGTGQWFLDSRAYQNWLHTDNQILFCPGHPGAGKTMLTSIVINDLVTKASKHGETGVAYIYFNFKRKSEQTIENILRSLLKQLTQALPSMPHDVKNLYDRETKKGIRPLLGEIIGALQSVSAIYSRVFIILDALDECETSRGYLSTLLSQVFDLRASTKLSLFATSRHIPDIEQKFKGCLTQEISASEEDVRNYVDGHTFHLPNFIQKKKSLQREIKDELVQAVDGMFLLAHLYLDSLMDKTSVREIKDELESLKKRRRENEANEVLHQAYDEAMERIDSQKSGFKSVGRKVLSWITCAKRPLTTLELQHALAIRAGDTKLHSDGIPGIEDMVSACAGLVTVDEASGIIRLVHYTTQEYFEQQRRQLFLPEMPGIAMACTTYLSFDDFQRGFCQWTHEFRQRLRSFPLYSYAACNWAYHAREASTEDAKATLDFLGRGVEVSASFQAILAAEGHDHVWYTNDQVSGLHLAAWFGLTKAVTPLLRKGTDINVQDAYGRPPLTWAAERGHNEIVRKLLDTQGINPDMAGNQLMDRITALGNDSSRDSEDKIFKILRDGGRSAVCGATPLWYAAWNGHDTTVELLLAEKVNINFQEPRTGATPLWCAARNGHETVVKLLLNNDNIAPDRATYRADTTPLSIAVQKRHKAIVSMLLAQRGVNPDSVDGYGSTPLRRAVIRGDDELVRLLLADKRVNPNLKDSDGCTPLCLAFKRGFYAIVKLFLSTGGVDLNYASGKYSDEQYTPLQWAIKTAHSELIKTLLADARVDANYRSPSNGQSALAVAIRQGASCLTKLLLNHSTVDPNSRDFSGATPLLYATEYGCKETMKLLLAADNIDPDAKDDDNETPLLIAADLGDMESVQLLLQSNRVNVNYKDPNSLTPLSLASESGYTAIAKLLLEAGAEPDCINGTGRTPLFYMAMHRAKDVLELLIADGRVELDAKDYYGMTPLSAAVCHSHEQTVALLLSTGAVDVESRDRFGRTPLWWAIRNGHSSISKLLIQNSERKGISVSTADLPPGGNSMSSVGTAADCSICLRRILVEAALYQCKSPHDAYNPLCGDCFEVGARCSTTSHEMCRGYGGRLGTVK